MPLGTSYGYPVKTADELGLTEYFRKNPKVSSLAWGGGLNGTDVKEPRAIVPNPFNRHMADPNKMQGLLKVEAARHFMDETRYAPDFELSEEQQEWRKTLGKVYVEDDLAAKQTIVSRVLANDKVPGVTPEQKAEADRINAILDERENPDFIKSIVSKLEGAMGIPRPWELTPGTSIAKEIVAGDSDDSLSEKARKGAARFIGRVATNVKEPVGYTDHIDDLNPFPHMRAILKDEPKWLSEDVVGAEFSDPETLKARDILYRELFDLPVRTDSSAIEKTNNKEYRLKDFPHPQPKPLVAPFPHSVTGHGVLGGVYLTPTPDGEYEYSDVWDLVSPNDDVRARLGDSVASIRLKLAPFLRPATVKGKTKSKK
jgi:hypothetical protein